MDYLSDVHSCCRGLESDKVTERKKNAEKLHQLLMKTSVIQTLDKNTEEKHKANRRLLTWDDIFKAVIHYVHVETSNLQKGKEKLSVISQQNKEKKKQEVSGLVKFVVKTADKRGPKLKCSAVIASIGEVLADEYMCSAYGLDFSNILLKNILPVRKYWTEIRMKTWHELLIQYCKLFIDREPSFDRVIQSHLIRLLVTGASKQCDFHPKKILQFYIEVFKNIRLEKASRVVENILASLNVFIAAIASNSRLQVCKLGENIFINLLYLWNNRPSSGTKDEIVKFLRLQLQTHHPGGAKGTAGGAFALDWDLWMSHLRKLYEVLYIDLKEMGGRHRFSSSKEFALKSDYVDLAADVCHQIFDETTHTIDVTQLPSTSDAGQPAKKRRLESGWSALRDVIYQFNNTMQIIPWIQLLSRLFEKYCEHVPQDELQPILVLLTQILEECKKSEILKHVFICLKKIIDPVLNNFHLGCKIYWQRIWSATLRNVSSHRAEVEGLHTPGFHLLTKIIQYNLIIPEKYVWNLYLPSISSPSPASINFLSVYLSSYELPEHYKPSILGSGDQGSSAGHPLRTHLLQWLIPKHEMTDSSDGSRIVSDSDKLSQVLVGLTLRNPEVINTKDLTQSTNSWTHLESVYMISTFDCQLDFEVMPTEERSETVKSKTCHMANLLECLTDTLNQEMLYFTDIRDLQLSSIEDITCLCSVLSKSLYYLIDLDVLSAENCQKSKLFSILRQLFKKLSTWFCDYVSKEGLSKVIIVIKHLQQIFTIDSDSPAAFIVQELNRSLTPSRLIDQLMEVALDKLPRTSSNGKLGNDAKLEKQLSFTRKPVVQDFDDLGFDDFPSVVGNESEELMEIESEMPDTQDSDDVKEQSEVCISLLSTESLSDHQTCRLEVIRLLCLWCSHDRVLSSTHIPLRADVETSFIRNKLTELLDESCFDCEKAIDLQILRCLITELTSKTHQVTDTDLENLSDGLRQVAKVQRRDEDIIAMCLDLLKLLIPYCIDIDDLPSTVKVECRNILLHLLSAFWTLYHEGQYTSNVRLTVAKCMEAFIKVDIKGEWSKIKSKGGDNDSEDSCIIEELPKCLKDTSHEVRLFTSAAIQWLFKCEMFPDNDRMFVLVYQMCHDLLNLPDKLSADREHDEILNRTSSLLLTLSTTAVYSQLCEKKAVFAFCQMIREKGIEIDLVRKILSKIAVKLGYKNVSRFLLCHLPFIINQWLHLSYPIAEFPYQLLHLNNITEFYKLYKEILVPELFMKKDMNGIEALCNSCRESVNDVILSCFSRITVHILPLFAASTSKELQSDVQIRKGVAHAKAAYERLCSILSEEVFNKTISENLDVIVVNILMCLHDDSDEARPEPNPPYYNQNIIISTLDYLTTSFSGNKSLISVLINKSQDAIQKILLELSIAMSNEHRLHEQHRILQMYEIFVHLLLKVFHEQLGGSWVFVLRDVIYRLVYAILDLQKNRINGSIQQVDTILEMCLSLLYDVCFVAVEHCPEELCKYLRLLTSNIVNCMKYGGSIYDKCKEILNMIVIKNTKLMKSGILRLDSFPEKDDFRQLLSVQKKLKYRQSTFTLDQEIEYFLDVCTESEIGPCSKMKLLQHLYKQLANNSLTTLKNHVTNSADNIFLRLIQQLLTILQVGNTDEKIESAKCLGIIGPVDLSVLSLPHQPVKKGLIEALDVYGSDPDCEKFCQVFHQLDQYLCDPSIDVVKCASEVLKNVLSTKIGIKFSTDYKEKLSDKDFLFYYLHPFRARKKLNTTISAPISRDVFFATIDKEELWLPSSADYDTWITSLTCSFLKSEAIHDDILYLLHPICSLKPELCDMILPYIIYDVLLHGNNTHKDVLSRRIDHFFKDNCSRTLASVKSISQKKKSVQTMLNVVQYLRQQERPRQGHKSKTPWDNNFWLDVDYLYISRAAQFCSAYFTSMLYSEIWWDVQREKDSPSNSMNESQDDKSSQDMNLGVLPRSDSINKDVVDIQDLMLEAYRSIGDPDGIYGCGAGRLADSTSRIKTYIHENRWDKAVVTYNIEMARPLPSIQLGFYQSIQEFGASFLLDPCFQGIITSGQSLSPEIKELQYEAAWKTGQWNLEGPLRLEEGVSFHQGLYCCLEAIKDTQLALLEKAASSTRINIVNKVDIYGDCCKSIYPVLSQLHCLQQLDVVHQMLSCKEDIDYNLLEQWNEENINVHDFCSLEPVLVLRSSIFKVLYTKYTNNTDLHTGLIQGLLQLSKQCRQAGRFQVSEKAVFDLRNIENCDLSTVLLTDMEEAKLYWARSEANIAKNLIKKLIHKVEKLQDVNATAVKILPQALGTYGNWLAETRSENPTIIMENYLEKTVDLLSDSDDKEISLEAYLSLARFADTQYQNMVNYMKSSTYESKQALFKKAKSDAERYKLVASDKDRYLRILEKQSEMDEKELLTMQDDRTKFLIKALEYYIKCLQCGDKYDLRIFRLVALWFDDSNSSEVNELLMENIDGIKSYKFLPLIYQLAARMGTDSKGLSVFQQVLNKILERTSIDHPHHALSVILALAFANKDTEILQQGRSNKRTSKSKASDSTKEESRVEAAKNMICRLKSVDKVCSILADMEKLSEAYIQLANANVDQYRKESRAINLPGSWSITQMKDLPNIAVPTLDTKVDATGNYDHIVYVRGFEKSFKLAGGINLPKIITCIGSDGIGRRQLVKGKDDLRQDAVMQQVFGMVNNLLRKNGETKKRKLHIRQYKVIPLSQRSGVLEWCEGTQPLGDYLIGNSSAKGAHQRYRPQDLVPLDARKALQAVHASPDVRKKHKIYKEVCQKFKPVFRHFFMEKFSEPAVWFERRLAYTRSVATNSIVGYILGLGDRHVQNILVDCNTAELVHIDLGIAFEQGKILPTPETVSFRLTRDIVDGMGPTGVEGVYRRCCEKTMDVMHDNQESLMTIVQVLLYDPLYAWTLSPQKAHALQLRQNQEEDLNATNNNIGDISNSDDRSDASQEQVNKLAERVLLRLQQKLQGIEDTVQLSILGQVNLLIEEARDPKKLCRLFPGWQPHL